MFQLLKFTEYVLVLQNLSFGIYNILFFLCTKFHNALSIQSELVTTVRLAPKWIIVSLNDLEQINI
ncbi:hypothetical protein BpHYR1_022854 [Brachionus plicatilis]|uniref:Uncharacterized protein n=1 Tax=Brachionus plicatilis TaxID=10195 RepID=A0A3M7PZ18_BRAPC|nr:hypothetical protein BpHYR1_022854 [Brachionus plicatilis]